MVVIERARSFQMQDGVRLLIGAAIVSVVFGFTFSVWSSSAPGHAVFNMIKDHRPTITPHEQIYFLNGVAYDFYSIDEFDNHSRPGLQWQIFPLPNEHLRANLSPWTPHGHEQIHTMLVNVSIPPTTTGLAFVDRIYIISTHTLRDRQANLQRMFAQYQIINYEWRLKWTKSTCNAPENKAEVYRKLNLKPGPLGGEIRERQCAVTMEHVDIWHEIVARNVSLALILEDDAVFVPFFREKFDRTIYTAIRTGALKIGGLTRCATVNNETPLLANSDEWIEQDPMIVIGSCFHMHDAAFSKNRTDAQPMLSTHKASSSRCSHAYLLTACSAQALLHQIAVRQNKFRQSDFLLNEQVAASPTLQAFWLDPPIVYQGNMIEDLDGIPSFKRTTY